MSFMAGSNIKTDSRTSGTLSSIFFAHVARPLMWAPRFEDCRTLLFRRCAKLSHEQPCNLLQKVPNFEKVPSTSSSNKVLTHSRRCNALSFSCLNPLRFTCVRHQSLFHVRGEAVRTDTASVEEPCEDLPVPLVVEGVGFAKLEVWPNRLC